MNCTICGFPMERVHLRDMYTCDQCQLELFPELEFKKKKYYHDGDGVIREKEEK